MIEVLSLPRRNNVKAVQIKNLVFKSGLPINSLPGWENIPLNCKLPMLKCPGNQVIFSKNKIGQSFKHLKQEFDPSGHDNFPEYNPLHDSNLKTFYANEGNLKRLRENGEITQNNDVICNLKDFNEYRQQLHKSLVYYVLQELNRMEAEQRDRMLISNAEFITSRDHQNLLARHHSVTDILSRKQRIDQMRTLRFQKLLQKSEENFERIANSNEIKNKVIEHKKLLKLLNIQRHWEICNEDKRKRFIYLKKLFQFKKERLQKNLKILREKRIGLQSQSTIDSWNKRLGERIANQQKIKILLEEVAEKRRGFIENHRLKYAAKWAKIQEQIQKRAKTAKQGKSKKIKRRRKKVKNIVHPPIDEFHQILDNMGSTDLADALKAVVEIEGDNNIPFDFDDPIYKAARFILKNIVETFDKDLSNDCQTHKYVTKRLNKIFDDTKKFVTYRATQIISHARQAVKLANYNELDAADMAQRFRNVSFSAISAVIGTSSYHIHPNIQVKDISARTPTPPGSLTSIVMESSDENQDKPGYPNYLARNETIFIEHLITSFKHELIVGVGRRTFNAIQCHYHDKIMDVRKELLDIDKQFLVDQMATAILSYGRNNLNFDSCAKLCTGALANDVVWSLQKHILRPKRDPRGIVQPRQCCEPDANNIKLCLFCE